MKSYALSHLTDQALLRDLAALIAADRNTTASMLAHLAEVDARKLYLPAAYPSMYAYCVGELHLSEDSAAKRIHAARAARRFPSILLALAEGRLHLAAVVLLAPHLTPENSDELITAATYRTKAQIELLLAQRFPQPDLVTSVEPIAPVPSAPGCSALVCESREQHAPGHVVSNEQRPKVQPLSPQRFSLQMMIDGESHDLMDYAKALLGHAMPAEDLTACLRSGLREYVARLEQRRFAATSRPRPGRRSKNAHHVPAHVRRTVWQRDGGQCTFVADNGHRCEARTHLEFDHVTPVARGGEATVDGMRLRCRAHNQYEAERVFGERFMRGRREAAVKRSGERRAKESGVAATQHAREASEPEDVLSPGRTYRPAHATT